MRSLRGAGQKCPGKVPRMTMRGQYEQAAKEESGDPEQAAMRHKFHRYRDDRGKDHVRFCSIYASARLFASPTPA